MICSPARVSRPMNGAVFQVSAITTAQNDEVLSAVQRIWEPSSALATPSVLKIHFQSSADTAVGIAHGTRMLARTKPLPRKAWCMTNAIDTPITISIETEITVKKEVLPKAFQNRSAISPWKTCE